jgi:hypothetical protein
LLRESLPVQAMIWETEITAKLDKFQVDMRQTAIDKGDALKAQLKNLATND